MENSKGLWSYENRTLIILGFVFGFVFFDRQAISYLFPFIAKDMGLDNTALGLLSSALALTWCIAGPLLSYISDNVRNKKAFLAAIILVFSLLSVLTGWAAAFGMMLVIRAIMGFAEGPVLPISQAMMISESSEHRRGFNLGFVQTTACNVIANMAGPLILVALATSYGWRNTFYLTIIPGIILAFFVFQFLRNPQASQTSTKGSAAAAEKVSFSDVLKVRNIWICTLMTCMALSGYLIIFIFGPNFLVGVRHVAPSSMSFIMAGYGLGVAVFGMVIPGLSDKYGRKPLMFWVAIISVLTPIAFLYLNGSALVFALVLAVLGIGGGIFPIIISITPAESVPVKYMATAIGLVNGIGELVAGVISPTIAGRLADTISPAFPFWIAIGCSVVTVFLALFIKETAPAIVKTTTSEAASAAN